MSPITRAGGGGSKAEVTAEKERAETAEALKVSLSEIAPVQLSVLTSNVGPVKETTTLADITGLGLAVGASSTEVWRVSYWLLVEAANTTMDSKFGFTVPASCTGRWGGIVAGSGTEAGWATAVASVTPSVALALSGTSAFGTRAGVAGFPITALVYGGGTAGTVQIQYAQNTSDAGNLTILKGSVMEAVRVAA